ncbi:MAG: hypothetical protein ACT4OU_04680 [Hyphomicrobium sp.]
MRRFLTIGAVCAALAAATGSAAVALEEQKAPASQTEAAPQAGVQDAAPAAKAETGTEIRIPGLGKLGTLPKMDFGLELLYGASDEKAPVEPPASVESPTEDLTIRGSVKHRF